MKQSVMILILMQMSIWAVAQGEKPDWIDYQVRNAQYPKSAWLVGFISTPNRGGETKEEMLEQAEVMARIQMVESLKVDIASITTSNITSTNKATDQYVKKISASYAKLQLTGFTPESWYDTKKEVAFAIAYANKADIQTNYQGKNAHNLQKLTRLLEQARTNTNQESAIRQLIESRTLFRETEEVQAVLVALGNHAPDGLEDLMRMEQEVNQLLEEYRKKDDLGIAEAALLLATDMASQGKNLEESIAILPFTYQDSKMSSAFAGKFQKLMERKVADATDWKVTLTKSNSKSPYLEGTYWEEGDYLRVISNLRHHETGEALSSAECLISKTTIQAEGVEYKPNNYHQALQQQQQIKVDRPDNTGLEVDIWTNKGQRHLIYEEGERMKLYAKTSRSAYLRFIYYLADGQKVLLLDNYYVTDQQAGQTVALPQEFECAAPFGVEHIQINASTEPFASLKTVDYQGYQIIQDDTREMLTKTRGFRTLTGQSGFAEKVLLITTVKY